MIKHTGRFSCKETNINPAQAGAIIATATDHLSSLTLLSVASSSDYPQTQFSSIEDVFPVLRKNAVHCATRTIYIAVSIGLVSTSSCMEGG